MNVSVKNQTNTGHLPAGRSAPQNAIKALFYPPPPQSIASESGQYNNNILIEFPVNRAGQRTAVSSKISILQFSHTKGGKKCKNFN
jgi:hypothetical protein